MIANGTSILAHLSQVAGEVNFGCFYQYFINMEGCCWNFPFRTELMTTAWIPLFPFSSGRKGENPACITCRQCAGCQRKKTCTNKRPQMWHFLLSQETIEPCWYKVCYWPTVLKSPNDNRHFPLLIDIYKILGLMWSRNDIMVGCIGSDFWCGQDGEFKDNTSK